MDIQDPRHNYQFTKNDDSRGGKVTAAESPLKAIASHMRSRKYCDTFCPFYESCPMLPLSMDSPVVVKTVRGKNGREYPQTKYLCKMRDAPVAIKRRITNMFLGGEDGLLNEVRNALFITSTTLGDDNKERMQYADTLMKFHKSVYGERGTQINSQEPLEITVRQLHASGTQAQEVKIEKISKRGLCSPESKKRREEGAIRLLERLQKPDPSVIEENDPESLYSSPIIDEILIKPRSTESPK